LPVANIKNFLLWLVRPFYSRDKQYWKVVLLCLAAASTFWLLNALNKSYTNIRTNYPLTFVYKPEQFIPLKPLPEEIEINVSGKGWKLLRKYLMLNVRPAEIVIRTLPRQNYIQGSFMRAQVAGVLDGLQLNFILTDTIHFAFDRRIQRKIALRVDSTQIKTADNVYIASPVVVAPDSVMFDGPASIVNKFPAPFPIELPTVALDRSFNRFVPLVYPNTSLVKASVPDVEVSVAISPIIWQQVQVTPVVRNQPADKPVQMQPTTVTIRCGSARNNAAPVTPDQFEVVVDYNTYNPADSTVALGISRKPIYIKRVTLEPKRIKIQPAA